MSIAKERNSSIESPVCLFCGSGKVRHAESLSVPTVVERWRETYDLDVTCRFEGLSTLNLWTCASCALQFFAPAPLLAPDDYAALEGRPGFYAETKWDFDVAIPFLPERAHVLEVGCGPGHFLANVTATKSLQAEGLETNPNAAADARNKGLRVESVPLETWAADKALHSSYDAICAFQVLEHLPNPHDFFASALALLDTGGRLLITVPNGAGFIRYSRYNLLNMPPYHCTRWTARVFERVETMFPVQIIAMQHEPLARHHLRWYVNAHLERLPETPFLYAAACVGGRRIVRPLLGCYPWLRRRLTGHSLFVCMEKGN